MTSSAETAPPIDTRGTRINTLLGIVFFASGFAALLYQVVWQRALYAIFGINVESVTIVVTAFLFGLGVGSIVGGLLAQRFSNLRLLFGCAEASIALYGLWSLQLFRWIGPLTLHSSQLVAGLATFLLLLPPTVLMGMTLPLLVVDGVRRRPNVGNTVSRLYFANTAGSAVAALAAVALALPLLGELSTVRLAAAINLAVCTVVLLLALLRPEC